MLILPYIVDRDGNIQFYLDNRYDRPKLFTENERLYGTRYTQLSSKIQLLLLDKIPLSNAVTKTNYDELKRIDNKILRPYLELFEFLDDNNKTKLRITLNEFKRKIQNYSTLPLNSNRFSNKEVISRNTHTSLTIMTLPENTLIYKAMPYTDKNITNNNPYALKSAWFSTIDVAKKYAKQENQSLKRKNVSPNSNKYWRVYSYRTVKPIKLIYLMDFDNLQIIVNHLKKALSKVFDNSSANNQISNRAEPIDLRAMKNLIEDINVVKALTGYEMTYSQQLEYIKQVHVAFRRKISNPEIEILRNYYNHEKGNRTKRVRYNIGNNYYSSLSYDLNRISMGTELDRSLLNILKTMFTELDGYVSYRVPSTWEYGRYNHNTNSKQIPSLDEEIGLFTQRGKIVRAKDDINDDRIFL